MSGFQHDLDATVLFVAKHLVHLGTVLQPRSMSNDEGWIDLPFLDSPQEVVGPAIYVSLAHPERQALVHCLSHRDLVHQAGIDTRNRDGTRRTADIDHLAQYVRPIAFHADHLLGAIVNRVWQCKGDMALQSGRVDTLFRPLAV